LIRRSNALTARLNVVSGFPNGASVTNAVYGSTSQSGTSPLLRSLVVVCASLVFIFGALPLRAASLFVAPNGSDNNSCTSSTSACLSFNGAYQKSSNGDVIQVAGGSYTGQNILYKPANACGSAICTHVLIQPATGASVTLNGDLNFGSTRFEAGAAHVTVQGITLTGDVSIPGCGQTPTPCPPDATSPGNDLTFQNLRVKGSYAFYCASCSNVTIDGGMWGPDNYNAPCTSDHHPEIASADQQPKRANHILIRNSEWKNFARCVSAEHTECLQIEPADDLTLRGNKFHDCDTIIVNIANDFGHWANSAAGFAAPNNILVEDNFFGTARDATGGPTFYALNIRECTNCTVRYNSWTQAPRMPTGGEISLNNKYEGNVGPMGSANCGLTGVTYLYNVWSDAKCSATDKQAASGFLNPSTWDLHLVLGSAAIGAGNPADYPAADIDGQARVSPPDAGADQLVTTAKVNAPSNLNATVR